MAEFPLIVARDNPRRNYREGRWLTLARAVPGTGQNTNEAAAQLAKALSFGDPVVEGSKVIFRKPIDHYEHMGAVIGIEQRYGILFNKRFGHSFFGIRGTEAGAETEAGPFTFHTGGRKLIFDITVADTMMGVQEVGMSVSINDAPFKFLGYFPSRYMALRRITRLIREKESRGKKMARAREAAIRWDDQKDARGGTFSTAIYKGVTFTIYDTPTGWQATAAQGAGPVEEFGKYQTLARAKQRSQAYADGKPGKWPRQRDYSSVQEAVDYYYHIFGRYSHTGTWHKITRPGFAFMLEDAARGKADRELDEYTYTQVVRYPGPKVVYSAGPGKESVQEQEQNGHRAALNREWQQKLHDLMPEVANASEDELADIMAVRWEIQGGDAKTRALMDKFDRAFHARQRQLASRRGHGESARETMYAAIKAEVRSHMARGRVSGRPFRHSEATDWDEIDRAAKRAGFRKDSPASWLIDDREVDFWKSDIGKASVHIAQDRGRLTFIVMDRIGGTATGKVPIDPSFFAKAKTMYDQAARVAGRIPIPYGMESSQGGVSGRPSGHRAAEAVELIWTSDGNAAQGTPAGIWKGKGFPHYVVQPSWKTGSGLEVIFWSTHSAHVSLGKVQTMDQGKAMAEKHSKTLKESIASVNERVKATASPESGDGINKSKGHLFFHSKHEWFLTPGGLVARATKEKVIDVNTKYRLGGREVMPLRLLTEGLLDQYGVPEQTWSKTISFSESVVEAGGGGQDVENLKVIQAATQKALDIVSGTGTMQQAVGVIMSTALPAAKKTGVDTWVRRLEDAAAYAGADKAYMAEGKLRQMLQEMNLQVAHYSKRASASYREGTEYQTGPRRFDSMEEAIQFGLQNDFGEVAIVVDGEIRSTHRIKVDGEIE